MPSGANRNCRSGNVTSGDTVSVHVEPSSQLPVLEEPSNTQENAQIQQLQGKIEELEKQIAQYKIQIKDLEDKVMRLQCSNSDVSGAETLTSTNVEEELTTAHDNQVSSVASSREPRDAINEQDSTISTTTNEKKRSVRMGNNVFARWMNSRDPDFSLWLNEEYRRPLLSYIGKIYGQKQKIYQALEPLRIEYNRSEELDQLYAIIQKLQKQFGAEKSLCEWKTQTRPDHRLVEIKSIFEYNSTHPLLDNDLKVSSLSPSNLEEIIPRESINGYFDMICRDGMITAEIGEYLNLSKENIFGGGDYVIDNQRLTFANVKLDQSIIDLGDNSVDLITCLVTLHHVPNFDSMLSELVRILRPGGYLLLREHDVKKERSLKVKYLNFVHAFMMIARVGEFANSPESNTIDWEQLKADIIEYTSSIQYRTRGEWKQALEKAGFRLRATIDYLANKNPQALYYAVFQLNAK